MFIMHTLSQGRIPVSTPWTDEASKNATVEALRILMRELEATQYVMMTEGWMVQTKDRKGPESYRRGASLASHPDREEVLIIMAENKTSRLSKIFRILRPEHGKPKLVEDTKGMELPEGRMIGLLQD